MQTNNVIMSPNHTKVMKLMQLCVYRSETKVRKRVPFSQYHFDNETSFSNVGFVSLTFFSENGTSKISFRFGAQGAKIVIIITPFIFLIILISLHQILEILMQEKCELNERDGNENTAIHIAATNGSLDCLEVLSKFPRFSFLLDERDENGMTALHLAASNKHA